MLTLIPARFTAWVTRTASAISVPATKRPETRWPMEERSEKLRRLRFSERWTKKALNMEYLPPPKGNWLATRGMKYGAKIGRPQNFVSQLRGRVLIAPTERSRTAQRSRRSLSRRNAAEIAGCRSLLRCELHFDGLA